VSERSTSFGQAGTIGSCRRQVMPAVAERRSSVLLVAPRESRMQMLQVLIRWLVSPGRVLAGIVARLADDRTVSGCLGCSGP
jgi:hypothetical protein